MKKMNPLLLLPGLLCWLLIGVGIAKGDMRFVGAGIALVVFCVAVGVTIAVRRQSAERAEAARIWSHGAPARAKVMELSTKGGGLNDNPKIDFELEITREGEPSFRAQVSVIVRLLAIPRVQPGCEIDVRLDPQDRSKVVIDEKLTYLGYGS